MGTISKILICDDHLISQVGLKYALQELFPERAFSFKMVGSGKEVVDAVCVQQPDLLILDLRLPDVSGVDILKKVKALPFPTRVMIMTGEQNIQLLTQVLRESVDAILLKSYELSMLREAFAHMEQDQVLTTYLDSDLKRQLIPETLKPALSPREREVLELIVKGHTNKSIATMLNCSPETVKAHRSKIREKTNLYNRDDISMWFYKGIENEI